MPEMQAAGVTLWRDIWVSPPSHTPPPFFSWSSFPPTALGLSRSPSYPGKTAPSPGDVPYTKPTPATSHLLFFSQISRICKACPSRSPTPRWKEGKSRSKASQGTHVVRLLSRVDANVTLERLQVAEAGPAGGARVRLLPGVDEHVCAQMRYLEGEEASDRACSLGGVDVCPLAPAGLRTCTKREPHVSHL